MADVFISYAKVDKIHAHKLAQDLKARGLEVWWDADLYASQDYHNAIMQALVDSEVAIVVWSAAAVKSEWVRDEARRAHSKRKLIPTYLPPFNIDHVPLGFGDIQAVDVTTTDVLYAAIQKHLRTRPIKGIEDGEEYEFKSKFRAKLLPPAARATIKKNRVWAGLNDEPPPDEEASQFCDQATRIFNLASAAYPEQAARLRQLYFSTVHATWNTKTIPSAQDSLADFTDQHVEHIMHVYELLYGLYDYLPEFDI